MTKVNRTLIIILFIFSSLPISTINAEILKHEHFEYKVTDGSVEVIGYTGEEGSNIIIPEQIHNKDVVSIGANAFTELHSEKVEFPNTLKVIKKGAFELNNFKNVEFNGELKKIESGAFKGSFIEEITFPESIEEIENDAFKENNINSVYGYEKSYAEEWATNQGYDFEYLKSENNVDFEDENSIEPTLENDDKDKNKVEEQSTEIDSEDENKIKDPSVESDDKDKTKDEKDKNKEEKTSLEDDKRNKTIEETNKNKKITSKKYEYTFKETIDSITINKYNGSDVDIKIPNAINDKNVIEIGEETFTEKKINSIELPKNIKKIGKKAFKKNNLKIIILPEGLTEIGAQAFSRNDIKKVTIPKSVKNIGLLAFDSDKIETISGYDGSEAQRYAASENFEFDCIDCNDDNEDNTEKDTSLSLDINKEDLNSTISLDKRSNFKLNNINFEITFGKDIEGEFTIQYKVEDFIHTDGEAKLHPTEKSASEFNKFQQTEKKFDANDNKVNNIINLDSLEFDNSKFIKKGNYKSVITAEVIASPSP